MRVEIDGLPKNKTNEFHEFVVEIHYDTGGRGDAAQSKAKNNPEGRFYVPLPQVMQDALHTERVYGKDEDGALQAFRDALTSYRGIDIVERSVILYEFNIQPRDEAKDTRPSFMRMGRPSSVRVDVFAACYTERTSTAGDGRIRVTYYRQESSLTYPSWHERYDKVYRDGDKEEHQVPWTEKNEQFFKWIETRLRELAGALEDIESPDNLIDMAESGHLLPLGNRQGTEDTK